MDDTPTLTNSGENSQLERNCMTTNESFVFNVKISIVHMGTKIYHGWIFKCAK